MPSYKLRITEDAVKHLEEACIYYENKVEGLGIELKEEIFQVFFYIEANPLMFSIRFANMHEAVVSRFPYIIVYEIIQKEIIITSVFNTSKKPSKKYKKK